MKLGQSSLIAKIINCPSKSVLNFIIAKPRKENPNCSIQTKLLQTLLQLLS
jgi:hypothetical protein